MQLKEIQKRNGCIKYIRIVFDRLRTGKWFMLKQEIMQKMYKIILTLLTIFASKSGDTSTFISELSSCNACCSILARIRFTALIGIY